VLSYLQTNKTLEGYKEADRVSNERTFGNRVRCAGSVRDGKSNYFGKRRPHQMQNFAEGANGPTTPKADKILHDNGIFVIPDILGKRRRRDRFLF
jgi:glutamate dehydrogenase (NAD(P)+)